VPSTQVLGCYRGLYLDVDFSGFLNRFLFDECNHPLEFVGDLFIAEAVRIRHLEVMSMNKVSVVVMGLLSRVLLNTGKVPVLW
jgi:hypothetical protein